MRGTRAVAIGLLAIGLAAASRPVDAAERVRIAVGGFGNVAYLPYDVARALGYFAEEGLDVEFLYTKGGSQSANALLAGDVDFSGNSIEQAIKAGLQGKPLTMIAAFAETPTLWLLVRGSLRETIRRPLDLKGRPIGVTGLGTATHMVVAYVLTRSGLRPEDVNAVPVGYNALAAALENGKVDGIIGGGTWAEKLVEDGRAFVLLDLMARAPTQALFGGPYVDTGVVTRPEVIERRPEVCRKLVRAVVRTNRWIASHSSAEIAARLPDAIVQDRRLYTKALDSLRDAFSPDGRINPRAVETVIRAYRAFGAVPADRSVDAARLYDNTFVDYALAGGS